MIIIAFLPKQYTDAEELFTYTPLLENKRFSVIYNGILTMFFSFVVILVRAFSFRLNESILDNETFEIVLTVDEEVGMTGAINLDVSVLNICKEVKAQHPLNISLISVTSLVLIISLNSIDSQSPKDLNI